VRFSLAIASRSAKQRALDRFQSQLIERPGGAIISPRVRGWFAGADEMFLL